MRYSDDAVPHRTTNGLDEGCHDRANTLHCHLGAPLHESSTIITSTGLRRNDSAVPRPGQARTPRAVPLAAARGPALSRFCIYEL
jgi:hypothetical protein